MKFVIDISTPTQISYSYVELVKVLSNEMISKVPVHVVLNRKCVIFFLLKKHRHENTMSFSLLSDLLHLDSIPRKLHVHQISTLDSEAMKQLLTQIIQELPS